MRTAEGEKVISNQWAAGSHTAKGEEVIGRQQSAGGRKADGSRSRDDVLREFVANPDSARIFARAEDLHYSHVAIVGAENDITGLFGGIVARVHGVYINVRQIRFIARVKGRRLQGLDDLPGGNSVKAGPVVLIVRRLADVFEPRTAVGTAGANQVHAGGFQPFVAFIARTQEVGERFAGFPVGQGQDLGVEVNGRRAEFTAGEIQTSVQPILFKGSSTRSITGPKDRFCEEVAGGVGAVGAVEFCTSLYRTATLRGLSVKPVICMRPKVSELVLKALVKLVAAFKYWG